MAISRGIEFDILRYRRGVITGETEEAPRVKTIAINIGEDFSMEPGQFNMLYIWGVGEVPISASNLPVRFKNYTVIEHTVRYVGAVTKTIYEAVKLGSLVGVKGPYGRGWPLKEVEGMDIVIVAGGIGMAPLRPLVKYVEKHRDRYGRVNLLYGARTPTDLLYKYELDEYMSIPNSKVMLSSDKYVEGWKHHVGFVTDLINFIDVNINNAVAFVCGPEIMMHVAISKLLSKGFKDDRIILSMERRMRCGVGMCGTCQFGHYFICKDGPVFRYNDIRDYFIVEGV